MRIFPKAKVVLTVRDPERWYESVKGTIFQIRGFISGTTGVFIKMVGMFRVTNLVNMCSNLEHDVNKQGNAGFQKIQ